MISRTLLIAAVLVASQVVPEWPGALAKAVAATASATVVEMINASQ